MNALNLYSIIEQDLDFKDEIVKLYDAYELLINQLDKQTLIDIGCGQGDFLLQLGQNKKLKTFGIDLSYEQVKISKQKNLDTMCIDIAKVKSKYDIATAIFDVLNYIKQDELTLFLKSTYKVLHNGGYFIFDINSFFGFDEVAQGALSIDKEDRFISIDAYFEDNKLTTNMTLFEKQKDDKYVKNSNCITQYYYSNDYLKDILQGVGFRIEDIISFNLHSKNEEDKYIFICKKEL